MQYQSPNPYFNLAMIRTPEMFFGRTKQLKRFYDALSNRQSVSMLGKRRIGKSSFLWCASLPEIQTQFSFDLSHHIFIFLDLHDYLHKTSEDFFYQVSKEIIEHGREKVPELAPPLEANGIDTFRRVLDQVARSGFFPVLLLDSFDKVTLNEYFGPEFFGFLRAQASRGRVSYVTASIDPLKKVCHRGIEGSPFFNIFYTYTLEALTYQETRDLITVPSQQAGVPFTAAEVKLVGKLGGRHPFFIQRVCHFLFEEKIQIGDEQIDELLFENEVYNDLVPHFEDSWDQLTEREQGIMRYEVRDEESQQRELPELSESALFRKFVRVTHQTRQFQIGLEELEDALDKINDPKALADGNLAVMQIVLQRLGKNDLSSPTEKGVAIRAVLREAFECLRASGTRSDSALEWRTYNILYYRYFKYHLKNEHIAARLGITSSRQYYRERVKAIASLHNVLLGMEGAPVMQK